MHIKIYCFAFLLLIAGFTPATAQQTDTLAPAEQVLNEAMLLKDHQQKQIDSLVKIQLNRQLADAAGNREKTRALEERLRQIEIADSLRDIAQVNEIKKLKQHAIGHPVMLNVDTLFMIYTRTGSFNAQERAAAISRKVQALYEDAFFSSDSLNMKSNADGFDIIYKNRDIVLTVSNLDGLWFGKTNAQLAGEYLSIIRQEVSAQREANSMFNWAKRIGLACLILLLLMLIVKGINLLFAKLQRYAVLRSKAYTRGLRIRNVNVVAASDLERCLNKFLSMLRTLVVLITIYLFLPLLFSIFPETKGWTSTLLGWILGPLKIVLNGIVHYLPNLFTILVIYFIFKSALSGIRYFFSEISRSNIQIKGFHADWALPTFNILRFVLYAFMLVVIFPYLPGSDSAAFQGVSVFLGILISLGSSSAITNIVAGLVITYMRPFKIGDRVKIGEVTGDVVEKTMLVTRIRTIKNEDVTVPNSMVLSSSTVNYSSQSDGKGLIVHFEVTQGYEVPWTTVYDLLINAARKTLHIEAEPAPFVLQTRLNDFYVSYQVNAYTKEPNKQALIYSNLLENIQNEFNAAGLELLSPNYNVLRKE